MAKVKSIKRLLEKPGKKTMKQIAEQFDISEMQLYRIKSGENVGACNTGLKPESSGMVIFLMLSDDGLRGSGGHCLFRAILAGLPVLSYLTPLN